MKLDASDRRAVLLMLANVGVTVAAVQLWGWWSGLLAFCAFYGVVIIGQCMVAKL